VVDKKKITNDTASRKNYADFSAEHVGIIVYNMSTYVYTYMFATRHVTTKEIVNRLMNSFRFPSVHTLTHRYEVQLIRSRSDAHHTDDACILIITLYLHYNVRGAMPIRSDRRSGQQRRQEIARVHPSHHNTHTHMSARPALTRKIPLHYIPCTYVFHNK
jgi:hypothetical protein